MVGSLDSLDFTTNVKLLGLVVKVGDSGMGVIIGTHDIDSFKVLVGSVDVGDYIISILHSSCGQDILVKIARVASSRGSRRATLAPAFKPRLSTCCWETSRMMGMGNSVPSFCPLTLASRRVLTTEV